MSKDYEKLFAHLKTQHPPKGLLDKIMLRIQEERIFVSMKRRLIAFATIASVSVVAFVPALVAFRNNAAESGFAQFVSLLFTDLGSIMANWQDMALAIMESLPAVTMAALLATVFVFLWSIKNISQSIKSMSNRHPQLVRTH